MTESSRLRTEPEAMAKEEQSDGEELSGGGKLPGVCGRSDEAFTEHAGGYEAYLRRRWNEGCPGAAQLHRTPARWL